MEIIVVMDAALLHTVWYGAVNHSCGWSCTAIQRRIPSFHVGNDTAISNLKKEKVWQRERKVC